MSISIFLIAYTAKAAIARKQKGVKMPPTYDFRVMAELLCKIKPNDAEVAMNSSEMVVGSR